MTNLAVISSFNNYTCLIVSTAHMILVTIVPLLQFSSVQFSHSVVSDSLWPRESHHTSLPVYHQLPEFIQTCVHRVADATQPSHPLSSPSPPALSLSQHQGLFKCVSSSHQLAKYWSFSFNISPSSDKIVWFMLFILIKFPFLRVVALFSEQCNSSQKFIMSKTNFITWKLFIKSYGI